MSCITDATPAKTISKVRRAHREIAREIRETYRKRVSQLGSERGLEEGLVRHLRTSSQRQVKTPFGIIDVLTNDTIYELKVLLTLRELHTAVGQLKLYQLAYPDRELCIVTLQAPLANVVITGVLQGLGIDILVASWEAHNG